MPEKECPRADRNRLSGGRAGCSSEAPQRELWKPKGVLSAVLFCRAIWSANHAQKHDLIIIVHVRDIL